MERGGGECQHPVQTSRPARDHGRQHQVGEVRWKCCKSLDASSLSLFTLQDENVRNLKALNESSFNLKALIKWWNIYVEILLIYRVLIWTLYFSVQFAFIEQDFLSFRNARFVGRREMTLPCFCVMSVIRRFTCTAYGRHCSRYLKGTGSVQLVM